LTSLDSSKFYYLEADVRIISHSLKDSGFFAGSEWPAIIQMGFTDSNGAARRFIWGFLDGVDEQGLRPYTEVEEAQWFRYRSPELKSLWDTRGGGRTVAHPVTKVYGLLLRAQGHNLSSQIGYVAIVEYDAKQTPTTGQGPCSTPCDVQQ